MKNSVHVRADTTRQAVYINHFLVLLVRQMIENIYAFSCLIVVCLPCHGLLVTNRASFKHDKTTTNHQVVLPALDSSEWDKIWFVAVVSSNGSTSAVT